MLVGVGTRFAHPRQGSFSPESHEIKNVLDADGVAPAWNMIFINAVPRKVKVREILHVTYDRRTAGVPSHTSTEEQARKAMDDDASMSTEFTLIVN